MTSVRRRASATARRAAAFLAVVASVLLCARMAGADELPAAAERGREIYLNGKTLAGREITALVGAGRLATPATALPCGSCHGSDGLGRPEGGVFPSNITWGNLTKPYGTLPAFGQRRPAYAAATLARAIALGIDSASQLLDASMPRYRMAPQDIDDLVAYLQRLDSHRDPGVSNERIILGTILPGPGPLHAQGQAMRAVVAGYLDDINARGGIYGRQLELDAREAEGKAEVLEQTRQLGKRAFALVSVFTPAAEDASAAAAEAQGLPTIGPITLFNQDEGMPGRFTFHLNGGLPVQARVLVEYASRQLHGREAATAVIHEDEPRWRGLAQAVAEQAAGLGWRPPLPIRHARGQIRAAELARQLKADGIEALFFFGSPEELLALSAEAERLEWTPYLFLPGSLAGKEILNLPAVFQDRVFLAYTSVPSDHLPAAAMEFAALSRGHALGDEYPHAQMSAYAATKLLLQGLKHAGRGLSREKLVVALEKLQDYETGLTPKLSYGPNRRIGALGAHMVAVDLERHEFKAAGEWIELGPK